jgi:hypothetical protein
MDPRVIAAAETLPLNTKLCRNCQHGTSRAQKVLGLSGMSHTDP